MARQSWITADIGTYALKAAFDYYREKSNQRRDRLRLVNRLALLQSAVHTKENEKKSKKKKEKNAPLPNPHGPSCSNDNLFDADDVELLYEENFQSPTHRMAWYPNITYQDEDVGLGCCCNFLVHSPQCRQAYFFARMAGAGSLCHLGVPPEEKEEDNEQQQPQQDPSSPKNNNNSNSSSIRPDVMTTTKWLDDMQKLQEPLVEYFHTPE
ncbi:hypothetical protein ACA910_010376 [Epithemia clementina (nom. ined.)]